MPSPVRIMAGAVNCYVLPASDGHVLIDAGMPKTDGLILRAIARNGIAASSVRLIVVTHVHYDHVGALSGLRRATGARVMVHSNDADLLRTGKVVMPPATNAFTNVISAIGRQASRVARLDPIEPDVVVSHDASLTPFGLAATAIHTPGHTTGSLSIVLENGDSFVGDLCYSVSPFGGDSLLPPFAESVPILLQSWKRILGSGAKIVYPGHGPPFPIEKLEADLERQLRRRRALGIEPPVEPGPGDGLSHTRR